MENDTTLTDKEQEILRAAKEANPFYFAALLEGAEIMPQRRAKYSGEVERDPFTNFKLVHMLMREMNPTITMDQTMAFYVFLKLARLIVTAGQDYDDESTDATLEDLLNYSALWRGERITRDAPES